MNEPMYYHIVTNLEQRFSSIDAAVDAYSGRRLIPRVPEHKFEDENTLTPRLCVCKWLPDCITAIGIRETFKRCLGANECIDAYDPEDKEVYPVLVLEFPDYTNVYKPSESDVEDADITNELWILHPVTPSAVYVRWLNNRSILFQTLTDAPIEMQAISCNFVTDIHDKDHPYLNGRGHKLTSTAMEREFEDYSDLPVGMYLGNVFTLKSTLEQIAEMTGWKDIKALHELRIKSEKLPENIGVENCHLEIICRAGNKTAPELYLELVYEHPRTKTTETLVKSGNFTDLAELQRTGVGYNGQVYRPRIFTIDADGKTGYIPANPMKLSNMDPTAIQAATLTSPDDLAKIEAAAHDKQSDGKTA